MKKLMTASGWFDRVALDECTGVESDRELIWGEGQSGTGEKINAIDWGGARR